MEQLQKDLTLWYSKLEQRGKIFLGIAAVGVVWLIFQLIWAIAGQEPFLPAWLAIIINLLFAFLIGLLIAQFIMMRRMQRDYEANLRQVMTKGRRGGNRAEQIGGVRNRGSMRQRGGMNMSKAVSMITQVDVEDLDKQYRPKPFAKPTIVEKWQEIEEPGMYALSATPKLKVEIIDAQDIGGGFFVGKYSDDRFLKDRRIMTDRSSGEPLRFSSLRNAKKALSGNKADKKRPTKKKRRKK